MSLASTSSSAVHTVQNKSAGAIVLCNKLDFQYTEGLLTADMLKLWATRNWNLERLELYNVVLLVSKSPNIELNIEMSFSLIYVLNIFNYTMIFALLRIWHYELQMSNEFILLFASLWAIWELQVEVSETCSRFFFFKILKKWKGIINQL